MGLNVSKLFVEITDQAKLKEAIEAYVKQVGSKVLTTNEKGAKPDEGRAYRTFALSREVDGKIAVFEDGATIADLKLAEYLSQALGTKTYWFQYAGVADYSGFCRYENGELIEDLADEDEPDTFLDELVEKYKLPWFWDTYKNPNGLSLELSEEEKEAYAKEHGFKDFKALVDDIDAFVEYGMANMKRGGDGGEPKLPEVAGGFIAFNVKV